MATKKIEKVKYLIIGNSAGGIGAVEAIREKDKTGTIAIISDEPYPAYSRPLISPYLAHERTLESMLYRPADFYEKNSVQAFLGVKVERLDLENHAIDLADKGRIEWQKLLLATGGVPIFPKTEGSDLKGVFTFTTLDDAKVIDKFLGKPLRQAQGKPSKKKVKAVVIGGGLIGVSVTEALVKRGVAVTIVELRERVLNVILDEVASALADEALKKVGVKIVTGHTVSKITGDSAGNVAGAIFDDGKELPCDMVIVAIGVQPRLELVKDTGIKVNRGIVVDRHMTTSNPDVYACGDVAEAYDFVLGINRLTPIWPNAYVGGRVAGLNMAGVPTDYPGGTAMNSSHYFGVSVVSAGVVTPTGDGYEELSARSDHSYKKVLVKDGLVVGMVFSGDIEKAGIIYNLIKDKVKVEAFKQTLVASDFGLLSLPEERWRPKLELPAKAAPSAASGKSGSPTGH
ncbi:MAG: NAD(P)/FAD-dependent oxidoreductase [Chloroflexi bacterium]|nr:NAD(P)/FAD-dependent oxidoreductase [Chloroflexota bacterium]